MDLMTRRRALLAHKKAARIPAEYQEVEYVGSTSYNTTGEYIETGIYPQLQDAMSIKFQRTGTIGEDAIRPLGAYNPGVEIDGYRGLRIWANNAVYFSSGNEIIDDGEVHTISCTNDGTWDYDGRQILTNESIQTQQNISIVLFKARYASNRQLYGNGTLRIFEFLYYRGGNLIMSLVPCYRKEDNVIGMYDLVTNTFFINAGTGEFTVGEDVN